ncbi:MAG: TIGR03668 family PPOX class F420-dependent oxidoreductase [Actinobacteria bacterium]|nr:MAG: TIGR03668 family PPOX class F420-dependent oxidoreductase [Actinomycetota bacterium]
MNLDRDGAIGRAAAYPVAHLATTRPSGAPHVVAITFAIEAERLYSMVDHKPKSTRRLQRLANIEANPHVSILVDHYEDDWGRLWWVRIDGEARVASGGEAWESARRALSAKYQQYSVRPPAGPAIVVEIGKVNWWEPAR